MMVAGTFLEDLAVICLLVPGSGGLFERVALGEDSEGYLLTMA